MPHLHTSEFIERRLISRSASSLVSSYEGVPCLEYMHARRGGYGRMWNGVKLEDTHVMSWRIHKGPIPVGHHVLHHCDNPACWEPRHLWTGTVEDNMRDKIAKGRSGSHKLIGRKKGPSHMRGALHPKSKLSEEQANEIKMAKGMGVKGTFLARKYGVSSALVYAIWRGTGWAWL